MIETIWPNGHTNRSLKSKKMNYIRQVQNKRNYQTEILLINFPPSKWNYQKVLGQIAVITRSRTEKNMLIVLEKSTYEKHLSEPLQTNNKQHKIALTILTGYNGFLLLQTEKLSILRYQFMRIISIKHPFHLKRMKKRA